MQRRPNPPRKPDTNEMARSSKNLKKQAKVKSRFPLTNYEQMQCKKGKLSYDIGTCLSANHTTAVENARDYCFKNQFRNCLHIYVQWLSVNRQVVPIGQYIPENYEFNTKLRDDQDPPIVTDVDFATTKKLWDYMSRFGSCYD